MKRNYKIYIPVVAFLIGLGLPSRIIPQYFPSWYVLYAGDFLWATVVFFFYCLLFNLTPKQAAIASLTTSYLIEISQLFHPQWLEQLRSIKVLSLILGFGFLWSDLAAYTLGIAVATGIDLALLKRNTADN